MEAKFLVDFELWRQKTELLSTKLIPYAKVTADRLAEVAFMMIKAKTPTTQTGTDIRGMWRMTHSRSAKGEEFIIRNLYPNQDVIVFFEEGTKPHEIRPVRKKCLRFTIETGEEIHTKVVYHPGTRGYWMLAETEDYMKPKMDWYAKQVFKMAQQIREKT